MIDSTARWRDILRSFLSLEDSEVEADAIEKNTIEANEVDEHTMAKADKSNFAMSDAQIALYIEVILSGRDASQALPEIHCKITQNAKMTQRLNELLVLFYADQHMEQHTNQQAAQDADQMEAFTQRLSPPSYNLDFLNKE